jgi:hypothetical protein
MRYLAFIAEEEVEAPKVTKASAKTINKA